MFAYKIDLEFGMSFLQKIRVRADIGLKPLIQIRLTICCALSTKIAYPIRNKMLLLRKLFDVHLLFPFSVQPTIPI